MNNKKKRPISSTAKNTPIHYKQTEAAKIEREIPPYNGWGSEEDSRANCLKLIAQAPKRDFIKFMKKDRWVTADISTLNLNIDLMCAENLYFNDLVNVHIE